MLSDAFESQIKLDRVVSAGAHGAFFPPSYGHSGQVSVCCRVNHQAINAPLFERLTAQVKCRGVQIEQVRQGQVALRYLGGGAFSFGSCSGHSTPPEAIVRAQRAQLSKIPGRLFTECCLPIRSERTGPRREQDRNRAIRYSESGSKKHSLELRNCSQPSPCQRAISSVQKNTREFSPRVFWKFEANLRVSLLLLPPG